MNVWFGIISLAVDRSTLLIFALLKKLHCPGSKDCCILLDTDRI